MLYFSFSIHNRHILLYFYKIIFYTLLSAENARFMFGKKRRLPPCDLRKPFQFLERMFAFIISIALYLVKRIPTVIQSFIIFFQLLKIFYNIFYYNIFNILNGRRVFRVNTSSTSPIPYFPQRRIYLFSIKKPCAEILRNKVFYFKIFVNFPPINRR